MKIRLQPDVYVVAVSGGVDSVVLLDLLAALDTEKYQFVVAHFDHGIRKDSAEDRLLVQNLATQYGLPMEYSEANLGANTSEASARQARYGFLNKIKDKIDARAIITAHHRDDVLETVFLNLIRGTNRKGLSSLRSTETLVRPLLGYDKQNILQYAKSNNLMWREDSTNQDTRYKRNNVRHNVMPKMSGADKNRLIEIVDNMAVINKEIDLEIDKLLDIQPAKNQLLRFNVIMLPHVISVELVAAWLRLNGVMDFDNNKLQRITIYSQVLSDGQQIDINGRFFIAVSAKHLKITPRYH